MGRDTGEVIAGRRGRSRARTGRLGPALLLVLVGSVGLVGCGQATTGGAAGDGTDAAPTAASATTGDGMGPDDSATPGDGSSVPPGRTAVPVPTGSPELLLPTSPASASPVAELPADPVGADLTLVVGTAGAAGSQGPVTLGCDWSSGVATGSHPQAEQACADLRAALAAGNPFTPVPPDTLCTQVYGGDAVVDVSGVVLGPDGGPVDVEARFSLTDGCEIDRWERMGAVLAPWGGAT